MSDIHHINLAGIDLNLLVVFDALITEQNLTRAGEKLGLSQPATSNALARLRSLINDDLFIRTATGLRPTPTAIALLLAEQNLKRRIALSIPHFLPVHFILAETDLIATLAQRIALTFANHQLLKLRPMPLPIKGFIVLSHLYLKLRVTQNSLDYKAGRNAGY